MISPQDTVIDPDLEDVLNNWQNATFANLNCIHIGKIEKVNNNQTCEITIQVKRRIPNDKISSYPLLVDCPYIVLSGGKTYLDMPILKGDKCLILFNDRNIDTWWDTENVAEPLSKRKHSLSDGIALVGIGSKVNFFSLNGDAIGLIASDKKVRVKNDLETLKTLMDDFIDTVIGLVTVGSPTTQTLDPATIAALEVIKTRMGTLLVD